MTLDGEGALARILSGVDDASLREPMLAELAELVRRRDAVAAAAGDPRPLGEAMVALEDRFEQLTGKASQRLQGMTSPVAACFTRNAAGISRSSSAQASWKLSGRLSPWS